MANILATQRVVALHIGFGFLAQGQGLRRIDQRHRSLFAIDQSMQEIEDMGLGRNARLKRDLDGTQDRLLVVVQHQRQDLYHLPIATRTLEQEPLQPPERLGQIDERRSIAQGARLALDHSQIVPPVINRAPWLVM